MRIIELDTMELLDLKYMAKEKAVESLKASESKCFSEPVREVFRNDFHRYMGLFKKAHIALHEKYSTRG